MRIIQNRLKLHSENPRTYIIDGKLNYLESHSESVVVDGETYWREWKEDVVTTYADLYKKNPDYFKAIKIEDFTPFGVEPFTVINISKITDLSGRAGLESPGISENRDANFYYHLYDNKIPELNFITKVWTSSNTYYYPQRGDTLIHHVLGESKIDFQLFEYAGSNIFYIEMDFKTLLRMNFKNLSGEYHYRKQLERIIEDDLLPRYVLKREYLSTEEKRLIMLNIFNRKIHYKRQQRQHRHEMSYY